MPPRTEAERTELKQLIDAVREGVYIETQEALTELRERGWLHDGSLNGAPLAGARLNGTDLRGAILSRADLSNADLNVAQLDRVRLTGAKLVGARLQGSSMMEADLMDAHLMGANLTDVKLNGTNLTYADLEQAILCNSSLREANLSGAELQGADLTGAQLAYATLLNTRLVQANLTYASLTSADLREAVLRQATLHNTNCIKTNFSGVDLTEAEFTDALFGHTIITGTDMSQALSLPTIRHAAPSFIDVSTLLKSGLLPEDFLRGIGLPDELTDHLAELRRRSVSWHSILITYSQEDRLFAEALYEALQDRGIRCWLNGYDNSTAEMDAGIHPWDAVLLCCSRASLTKGWAAREARWALEREGSRKKRFRKQVLLPLNLDNYLFTETCRTRLPGWERIVDRKIFAFLDYATSGMFDLQVDQLVNALGINGDLTLPNDNFVL